MSSRSAWATQLDPVSNKTNKARSKELTVSAKVTAFTDFLLNPHNGIITATYMTIVT
jgi:hypothetical protein